ncbi:MAG: hypothetical protein IKS83_00130 [Victivallales bacterium]|nr:hypothetical protein [Victivallales bacterium]
MSKQPIYHPNQDFVCPQCGLRSVVRAEEIVAGLFEVVGKRYVCSSCGWQIPDEQIALSSDKSSDRFHSTDDETLNALFGENLPVANGLTLEDEATRFCKNCKHYLQSPFLSRCLLHNREVEPLEVCEQFSLPSYEKS